MSEAQKADLLATSIDESERLNRFIANLLDMTKLESGAVVPNVALHDLGEIVGSALERTSKILAHHRVEVELAKDLPMVEIDPVLFEQVLFNLLDNAAKYAPAGTTVESRVGATANQLACRSWMRVTAFHLKSWSKSSISFIAHARLIGYGQVLGLASQSLVALSKPWKAAFGQRTERSDGAVFTIKLPVPTSTERLDVAA